MKNKKMIDLMGLADEGFISEADPSRKRTPKKRFNWTAFLAAACCFLLILNIAVIVPFSISDSEHIPVGTGSGINQTDVTVNSDFNHIKNPQSSSTNQSSGLQDYPLGGGTTDSSQTPAPPVIDPVAPQFIKNPALISALDKFLRRNQSSSDNTFSPDEEINDALDKVEEEQSKNESAELEDLIDSISPDINDNQVSGVSEADIAKRSTNHLFYMRGQSLYVYSLKGAASTAECIFPLNSYISQMNSYMKDVREKEDEKYDKLEMLNKGAHAKEMFLSTDFKTLTIIITNQSADMTGIFVFDVGQAPAVVLKSFHMLSGSYVSSRMVNGELLLFTRYEVPRSYNEDEPSTYIPFYVYGDREYLTNDIYFPSELNSSSYLTVTRLKNNGASVEKSLSYLSFSDTLYVSQNNIFISRRILMNQAGELFLNDLLNSYNTEIVGINYSEGGLTHKGAITVKGQLNNQYSLDEHEGILRAVTTTYLDINKSSGTQENSVTISDFIGNTPANTSASLYCIDLSSWEIRASVENFAPTGEVVRSVRFDGTSAYVCTSLQEVLVDPVFFFDLSDLDNITYTETGEMAGYSSSLINFGNGYVAGIGYGDLTSTLKIDIYKETNGAVEVVCSYEFHTTKFSLNYKSYFIDRERHLIGIGISSRVKNSSSYEDYYLLLYFNGSYFDFILNERVEHNNISSLRSFLHDGFVYVVTDTDFKVFETGSLDNLPFAPEEEIDGLVDLKD